MGAALALAAPRGRLLIGCGWLFEPIAGGNWADTRGGPPGWPQAARARQARRAAWEGCGMSVVR